MLGSRYVGGIRVINWPLGRLMLSRSVSKYVSLVTGMPFSLIRPAATKCFRRRALQPSTSMKSVPTATVFQIELAHRLWRQGYKIVEVPIIFTDRTHGQSKMAGGIVNEAFWLVWRLWWQNGLRRSPRQKNPATT